MGSNKGDNVFTQVETF